MKELFRLVENVENIDAGCFCSKGAKMKQLRNVEKNFSNMSKKHGSREVLKILGAKFDVFWLRERSNSLIGNLLKMRKNECATSFPVYDVKQYVLPHGVHVFSVILKT